jgi:hypothetical protein
MARFPNGVDEITTPIGWIWAQANIHQILADEDLRRRVADESGAEPPASAHLRLVEETTNQNAA